MKLSDCVDFLSHRVREKIVMQLFVPCWWKLKYPDHHSVFTPFNKRNASGRIKSQLEKFTCYLFRHSIYKDEQFSGCLLYHPKWLFILFDVFHSSAQKSQSLYHMRPPEINEIFPLVAQKMESHWFFSMEINWKINCISVLVQNSLLECYIRSMFVDLYIYV